MAGKVSVDYSPWIIEGDSLFRQYDFSGTSGPGSRAVVQLTCALARPVVADIGWAAPTYKHIAIGISPDLGYPDCYLIARFALQDEPEAGDFFPIQASPAAGGSTLLMVPDLHTNEKVFRLLKQGRDMAFFLMDTTDTIVKLLLPNDPSFFEHYEQLEAKINPNPG